MTRWWGPMEDDFPWDEPEAVRFAIVVGGEVAGLIQFGEEPEPEYRHAWIDVFLGDEFAGRGIGTAAIRRLLGMLFDERGHHRVTIDPELANEAAIRSYERCGFERVGVMRASWFNRSVGGWCDALLMELVRPELARPPAARPTTAPPRAGGGPTGAV